MIGIRSAFAHGLALAVAAGVVLATPAQAQNDEMTPIATPAQPNAIVLGTGPLPGATVPESWHSQYGSKFARNAGDRPGDEVAQLHLDFPDPPGTPRIALRGFRRLSLRPGEAQTVTFDLSPRDLSSVTPDGVHTVFAGIYRVTLGSGQPGTGVPVQSAEFRVDKAVSLPE